MHSTTIRRHFAVPFPLPTVTEFSGRTFGLLIAYVIPGSIALWGVSFHSATVSGWLAVSPAIPGGLEAVFFVTLASTAAGLVVSAIRWLIVDLLHHSTGVDRPEWDDGRLQHNLQAFDLVVEAHYRYYQFYANSAVAIPFAFACWLTALPATPSTAASLILILTGLIELILLLTSRDNLRKYYARTARILGSVSHAERRASHVQRQSPRKARAETAAAKAADESE